jgi:hypothetical protein
MKHATLLALLVLTLSIAGTAQLGSTGTITAKVPFEFVAWNTVVPAGECTVQRVSMGGPALAIQNFVARKGTMALAIQDGPKPATGVYALVFHKYGDRHFLTQIRTGDGTVYKLPKGKLEGEMVARNQPIEEEILLASAK